MKYISLLAMSIALVCSCSPQPSNQEGTPRDSTAVDTAATSSLLMEGENHLQNIQQLTFGGDNAEAYWSFDGQSIVFQAANTEYNPDCDQIYVADAFSGKIDESAPRLISTGKGRTTCAYFMPGDSTIVYASTHLGGDECPPKPAERTDGKYVWPIYDSYDIFVADLNGTIISQLTDFKGYDAEATVSPQGDKIVFTSLRTGDLELFTMNIDGSDVKQITHSLGYDGGAFFSPDGSKLVFRASRPKTEEEITEYKNLLAEGLVKPTEMEVFVCNIDGTDMQQVTNLGQANWAPYFHPSGEKILFASNHESQRGFPFNLYLINIDGSGLEKVSNSSTFDAFPMFSPDGSKLIFASNRNNGGTRDTNLFIADWID